MEIRTDFSWAGDTEVSLTMHSEAKRGEKRPAVLALPGGGYEVCAPAEGAPVAERFAALGYAAFALKYSVKYADLGGRGEANPHTRFPEPLEEVGTAMRFIAAHADEWGLDSGRMILAGFSAGGHLAACYMNLWERLKLPKPALCLLVYPAVDLPHHSMMKEAVFGAGIEPAEDEMNLYRPTQTVGPQTPPCFLVHSVTDPMVPVQESIALAQTLDTAGVPYELHLFGCGAHAYGTGTGQRAGTWTDLADSFIRHIFTRPASYDKQTVRRRFFERT